MQNLAGVQNADAIKLQEMTEAGIFPVYHNRKLENTEVPGHYTGEVYMNGDIATFRRAWYYWVVDCKVPLSLAREIYTEAKDLQIRVAGHCENPHPDEWALHKIEELEFHFRENSSLLSEVIRANGCFRYIETYHIDTIEGLKFFVDKIKSPWVK